jgi:hypothetical protein
MAAIIERVDAHAAKLSALFTAADRIDDGRAVAALLAYPKTAG